MAERKKMSVTLVFGLIAAAVMMLFVFGTYRAGPQVFLGHLAFLGNVLVIGLAAAAAFLEKKANGGRLEFKPALKTTFSVLVLGVLGQYFFTWLLLNVIDPHFKAMLAPVVAENTEKAYRMFNVPEDQIQRALDAQRGQDSFTFGRMLQAMGFVIVPHFLIALVIAVIVKSKKEPLPEPGL
jgi:Protein of unknown function (DUF4199)